jgi:hypothetical protein
MEKKRGHKHFYIRRMACDPFSVPKTHAPFALANKSRHTAGKSGKMASMRAQQTIAKRTTTGASPDSANSEIGLKGRGPFSYHITDV